jgi:2-methylcitrate dehydratase
MDEMRNDDAGLQEPTSPSRRDLIRMGVGAGVVALSASAGLAQQERQTPAPTTGPLAGVSESQLQRWPEIRESEEIITSGQIGYRTSSGPGWINNSGRAYGNGPMDECSRRLVDFVTSFSEASFTDSFLEAFNYLMVASLADLYSGFESEPARINARLSQTMRGDMKCTVVGYGITTTPEMAAFTHGCMIRHADFNDHKNELLWGVIAIGEALHSSGPQIMAAITIAYEVIAAIAATGLDGNGFDVAYHAPATALACGRLMGLNKDQLANALSLAMVPHMPLYVTHIGTLSMWKGNHSAEQVRNGVWAALLARAGMTGPCQPFEGRDGLIEHFGGRLTRDLVLPTSPDGRMSIETEHGNGKGYKRFTSVGSSQNFLENIAPSLVEWVKPEEVAAIDFTTSFFIWQEDGDPPKWDPQNRETADHSLMYIIPRTIIDKHIYVDSFKKEKYTDPAVRELMAKVTMHPNTDPAFGNEEVLTVQKKSGEVRTFKGKGTTAMGHDELIQRYSRMAEFKQINKEQADRAREQWMNLQACKDIAEAVQTIAKFGQPKPLSDMTPAEIS